LTSLTNTRIKSHVAAIQADLDAERAAEDAAIEEQRVLGRALAEYRTNNERLHAEREAEKQQVAALQARLTAIPSDWRETVQRERDRAQAIIHAVGIGLPISWGMYLKNGVPDVEAITADARKTQAQLDELQGPAGGAHGGQTEPPQSTGSQPSFKCQARQGQADPPQDCDWPMCGCDPYADKVIAALQESGKLDG